MLDILLKEILDNKAVVDVTLFRIDAFGYKITVTTADRERPPIEFSGALDTIINRAHAQLISNIGRN